MYKTRKQLQDEYRDIDPELHHLVFVVNVAPEFVEKFFLSLGWHSQKDEQTKRTERPAGI